MNQKLVTFDLGGVVVKVAKSIEEAATRAGVVLSTSRARVDPDKLRDVLDAWQVGRLNDTDFFRQWAEVNGYRFSLADAQAVSSGYLMGQFDGLREITDTLTARGIEVGCLSNTSNHHWEIMRSQIDIYPSVQTFRHPHASHLFGVMKPASRIYAMYEEATGYAPEQIVFFDDLPDNVEAAHQRGWHAFQIMPDREPSVQIRQALVSVGVW